MRRGWARIAGALAVAAALVAGAWGARDAACADLKLRTFGSLEDILRIRDPWKGFDASKSPALLMTFAKRVADPSEADCLAWKKAFQAEAFPESGAFDAAWGPWKPEERAIVEGCGRFPCKVKLDAAEVQRMAGAAPAARLAEYLKLVRERIERYRASGERRAYEFKGKPVEPWGFLEEAGFRTPLPRPAEPELVARILHFAPERFRAVRQVLDRRKAASPEGSWPLQAALWVRDVYTAHYFEGWGEWASLECLPVGKGPKPALTFVHALEIELDQLKSDDWMAKISQTRMKDGVREHGQAYLSRAFARIEKAARSQTRR